MSHLSVDQIIDRILLHPTFLKLKNVVENVPNIHDHEDVYAHCVKTLSVARDFLTNLPLTDFNAKRLFEEFVNEEIDGIQRKDILMITALLHDSGKGIKIIDGEVENLVLIQKPSSDTGLTMCPGHEYLGSKYTVPYILSGLVPEGVVHYISHLVRLHDTFNTYFPKNWTDEEILYDVKCRAEGYYIEALFNSYCDVFHSPVFEKTREEELKLLNNPKLYSRREYKIED